MAGNTFGQVFRVTTWGESHGPAIGATVDGCPPGINLSSEYIQIDLDRRKPGRGGASSPRKEEDKVEIMSGVFEGQTTGTPISLVIHNKNAHPGAYDHLREILRPGHGDYTYLRKYGIRDHRGGGRSSARETAARVAAGAIARKLLETAGIKVLAYTIALGEIKAQALDFGVIEENNFRCPDENAARQMEDLVTRVKKEGDTLGGIVEIRAEGCPPGLGEPVFDKLDADLAGALMSIGAVKGVEIGAGFRAAALRGSENNDIITSQGFSSNNSGGILAGISNGETIVARTAVKPIPSLGRSQQTVNLENQEVEINIGGRHDISAIPRIVPVCEAMTCITLADHFLREGAIADYVEKKDKLF